jgi:DNA helicase HerA-like ATPase
VSKAIKLGATLEGAPLELDIPRLIDSRMLIQGNSGGGKSWLLRLLCERAAAHVPIIVLDPEGEFASLREKLDLVLVGNDGEIATDLHSAGLLARKLIELEVSAVIDLYELKAHERREYVKLFLNALVELPRSLWHPTLICLDEAHKFAPEKGTGEAVSTQAVIDLMSLGRKRGFAGVLATQRFSKLHNDAIAETNNVFIGRTWLDADQKRAGEYLGMAAADRRQLRELGKGEFYAFGPALSIGGVNLFKSDMVATTHPQPGERHKLKAPLASDAIKHIVGQLEGLP